MRINIYHHELRFMADRCDPVKKTSDTGITFYGIRLYTEAPLMHQPGDDDSSAITLWVPWTKRNGHDTSDLREIARQLVEFCDCVDEEPNAAGQASDTGITPASKKSGENTDALTAPAHAAPDPQEATPRRGQVRRCDWCREICYDDCGCEAEIEINSLRRQLAAEAEARSRLQQEVTQWLESEPNRALRLMRERAEQAERERDLLMQSKPNMATSLVKMYHQLEQAEAKARELEANAKRWKAIELLWFCGIVELDADDHGCFRITYEGAETADFVQLGDSQEQCIDAWMTKIDAAITERG